MIDRDNRSESALGLTPDDAGGVTLRSRWPWWLNPALLAFTISAFSATASFMISDEIYQEWGTKKFLNGTMIVPILTGILALVLGIAIGMRRPFEKQMHVWLSARSLSRLHTGYRLLFGLTLFGYLAWTSSAIAGGVTLADASAVVGREIGAISKLKQSAVPVAGLSTFTQMAPMAAAIGFLLWRLKRTPPTFLLLIGLALVRTVFYAERLALIEVLLPISIVWILIDFVPKAGRRWLNLFPFLAISGLFVLFSIGEYFRSWIFHSSGSDTDYLQWSLLRLVGYYATAYNNSGLFSTEFPESQFLPYFSLLALWSAPGISTLIGAIRIGNYEVQEWWPSVLTLSNPEFTNKGTFLVVHTELGGPLAAVYWILLGLILGYLYLLSVRGSATGVLGYAVLLVGILELPRILYFSEGRTMPVALSIVIIGYLLKNPTQTQRFAYRPFSSGKRFRYSGRP